MFVSPNGNDKNIGSKQKPFKTIQKEVNIANSGTKIYVRNE
ncbi:DUF1565 domain-containing protein [Radiobacillus deserti]|uniref:DUF1565 domain-containing protein n=1 Tax=Radiobacillus deserti TaxID=2594883 RepID=A0A516KG18_9BACI|nr:DUF1565 domain-containing protein [Radiobacillus deserti]